MVFGLDPQSFCQVVGFLPSFQSKKCKRDYYKNVLVQSIQKANVPVNLCGIEFASQLSEAMDMYRAGKNQPSLRSFIDTLREKIRQIAEIGRIRYGAMVQGCCARTEVREGRSFHRMSLPFIWNRCWRVPPELIGSRHSFLHEPVLRVLFGNIREWCCVVFRSRTANTAVMTLITQFGGGKTHTLAALYHLVTAGPGASGFPRG